MSEKANSDMHGGRPQTGIERAKSNNQGSASASANRPSGRGIKNGSNREPNGDEGENGPSHSQTIPQTGYLHLFHHRRMWNFRLGQTPFFYKPAPVSYTSARSYRIRDAMRRVQHLDLSDRSIDAFDGQVCSTTIQAADDILSEASYQSTWDQTFIVSGCGIHTRLGFWPGNHDLVGPQGAVTFVVRHSIASVLLAPLLILPFNAQGEIRNNGRYDAFPYRLYSYTKVARNQLESKSTPEGSIPRRSGYRALGPSHLLEAETGILNRIEYKSQDAQTPQNQSKENGPTEVKVLSGKTPDYLFICWTSKQFPDDNSEIFNEAVMRESQKNELGYYWLSSQCMPGNSEDEVWSMSDVIRAAANVVIVVHDPPAQDAAGTGTPERSLSELLKEWGKQVWTLPEVLLCKQHSFTVYKIGRNGKITTQEYTRYQLAQEAWSDSDNVRQLVDHFENNLTLSRLEMSTIALQCLYDRELRTYFPGDRAYALMGLARIRPTVNKADSEFQAFARISLANDNDLLLERAACILPEDHNQEWHNMTDAYGAQLWDIYPDCQIAGVGGSNEMVMINKDTFLAYGDSVCVRCKQDETNNYVDRIRAGDSELLIHENTEVFTDGQAKIERGKKVTIRDDTTIAYVEALEFYPDAHVVTPGQPKERTEVEDNFGNCKPVRIGNVVVAPGDTITVGRRKPSPSPGDGKGEEDEFEIEVHEVSEDLKVIEDHTILVDGARGAAVKWNGFEPVHVNRPWSWFRVLLRIALPLSIILLVIGASLLHLYSWIRNQEDIVASQLTTLISPPPTSPALLLRRQSLPSNPVGGNPGPPTNTESVPPTGPNPTELADQAAVFIRTLVDMVIHTEVIQDFGIVLVTLAVLVILLSPSIIRYMYGGQFTGAQPWLFGFEGYLPIDEVETMIFGDSRGRLMWHPYGSPLSRHEEGESNECLSCDPSTFPEVAEKIERAKCGRADQPKIFTLVDTYTNTVTLFEALRPPVVFLLLGREGGMQRAVGCSYDWAKATLVRETVLRMETAVREKMDGIPRLRLSLRTSVPITKPSARGKSTSAPSAVEEC